MNKLWHVNHYAPSEFHRTVNRSGIRAKYDSELHPFVKRELKLYPQWLRYYFDFPIEIRIYFRNAKKIIMGCVKGGYVSHRFFARMARLPSVPFLYPP